MKNTNNFFSRKHPWLIVIYMIFYLSGFALLEQRTPGSFHLIHLPGDDLIPFCEYFIIPYVLWFVYIAAVVIYFTFFNKNVGEYWRVIITLCIGMTLFLFVSWIYPNGHDLRPETFARDNIFTQMVQMLYTADTSTNILPSIHVFNSVAVAIALEKCQALKGRRILRKSADILSFLIVLSTMFLKQHSLMDVMCALALNVVVYMLVYVPVQRRSALPKHQNAGTRRILSE